MLTTMFYYDYYKPYMVRDIGSNTAVSPPKRKKMADTKSPDLLKSQAVILNKSLKMDVVKYANDISNNVVKLKDAAKDVIRDMEDFNANSRDESPEIAMEWIGENLEDFAERFNSAMDFMTGQQHSAALRGFAEEAGDRLALNMSRLERLGLSMSTEGKLAFDKTAFDKVGQNKIQGAIGDTIGIFGDVYDDAMAAMRVPMSEHMNFRGLNYHYNYKMGAVVSDSFNMIEAGMIVDRVV